MFAGSKPTSGCSARLSSTVPNLATSERISGARLRFAARDFAIVAALQRRNDSILSKPLSMDS
jgi:hypothetical protein